MKTQQKKYKLILDNGNISYYHFNSIEYIFKALDKINKHKNKFAYIDVVILLNDIEITEEIINLYQKLRGLKE